MSLPSRPPAAETLETQPSVAGNDVEVRQPADAGQAAGGVAATRVGPRRRRWFGLRLDMAIVLALGGVLRLGWALAAWATPASHLSDSANYLRMASDFSRGRMPTIGNFSTAFYPPGYSIVLAPFAWVGRHTGLYDLAFAAAMFNVVAGTFTLWLVYRLALHWFDHRVAVLAAGIVALLPEHILLTAAPVSEVVFTCALVGAVVGWLNLANRLQDGRPFVVVAVGFGVVAASAMLIRSAGIVLIPVVLMVSLSRLLRNRRTLQGLTCAALGASAVLVPWAVRNQADVGVFTPLSTNAAAFGCLGNNPTASGGYADSFEELKRCFAGSPFSQADLYDQTDDLSARSPFEIPRDQIPNEVDEARWYRQTSADTSDWIRNHPARFLELAGVKAVIVIIDTSDALDVAEDNGNARVVSERDGALITTIATASRVGLFLAAFVALLSTERARRAYLLWLVPMVSIFLVTLGMALPRYAVPVMPFVAVLAAVAGLRIARLSAALSSPPAIKSGDDS